MLIFPEETIGDFRQFFFTSIIRFILWRLPIFLLNSIVCNANKVIWFDEKKGWF